MDEITQEKYIKKKKVYMKKYVRENIKEDSQEISPHKSSREEK